MRALLFAVLATVASVSFAEDQSEYQPLAKGMEWIMDAKITAPDGKVINTTARRKVGAAEQRNGNTYHRVHSMVETPQPLSDAKLVRKDQSGVYSLDPKDENATEQTEARIPLKVGDKWSKKYGSTTTIHTVLGIESVTINGRTYENCYHIQSKAEDGSYTENYWEAPKVGTVKSELAYGNGARISLTLREFKPGKE